MQTVINSWFDYRYICYLDNTRFINAFQRLLNRDYDRYRQLLRIEPGIAEYDWMVQQYNEAMATTENNSNVNGTVTVDGSITTAHDVTVGQTHNNTETTTDARQVAVSSNNSGTVNNTKNLVDSGTIGVEGTVSRTTHDEGTKGNTYQGTVANTGTVGNSGTTTSTPRVTTTNTNVTSGSVMTENSDVTTTDNINLTKSDPMSIENGLGGGAGNTSSDNGDTSASASGNIYGSEGNVPNLDWQYASSQAQATGVTNNGSSGKTSYDDYQVESTTSYDGSDTTSSSNTRTDNTLATSNSTSSETTENDGTDSTTTEKNTTSSMSHTGTDNTTTSSNGLTTTTNSGNITVGDSGTATTTTTGTDTVTNATGTTTINSVSGTGVTKTITTGRSVDPATLLTNAVSFITNTSAWAWLYKRLDTCFIGIYDEDEYEESED